MLASTARGGGAGTSQLVEKLVLMEGVPAVVNATAITIASKYSTVFTCSNTLLI